MITDEELAQMSIAERNEALDEYQQEEARAHTR